MYETEDDYTSNEITEFRNWFDDEIGTDYEVNDSASGEPDEFYIVFFDLEGMEPYIIRAKEKEFRIKFKKDIS